VNLIHLNQEDIWRQIGQFRNLEFGRMGKVLVLKLPKPEDLKPKELKWWGTTISPGGDVDPRILK
jgi:hypothetical protein